MASGLICGSMVFAILGMVVFLVGFGAPYWIWEDISGVDTQYGIWMICQISGETISCQQYVTRDDISMWLRAVEGCETLCFLIGLFGIILGAVLVCKEESSCLKKVTAALYIFAAMFGIAGCAVFGVKDTNSPESLHFAFGFCLGGSVMFLIAGLLVICSICKGENNNVYV